MREQRKRLQGIVTSNKMEKTAVVSVTTTRRHPVYGKILRLTKKYKIHDENNECGVGDRVEIIESRPLSREKRFALVSVLEKAR